MNKLSTEIGTKHFSFRNYKPEQFTTCVESMWLVETFAEEVDIVVPPNQFIDWIFLLKGEGYFHNGSFIEETRLEGIMLKPVYLKLPPYIKALGVRLYGNGLYPFLPLQGKNLINKNIAYQNPAHEHLIHAVKTASDDEATIKATYQLLNQTYCAKREKETKLVAKFYSFLKANEDLSDIQTHFIKEFKHYMGMSPSEYLNLLNRNDEHQVITKIDLSVI